MLKRYQVLLPDWLDDYIKFLVDKYDLSFSEVIRMELCIAILNMVPHLFPELKPDMSGKDISNYVKQNLEAELEQEEIHRLMSKVYFEARKAVEYRLAREKKKQKK
ncbi:MAG: hypothetical protein GTN76_03430 [Candidatus Aenigmarchaeota archaeon]|nr:hypothetical protein [Candidatus Aenigmarchaeota archaeon]